MKNESWNKDWPKTPGDYWFYGKRFDGDDIEFRHFKVFNISNGTASVCEGNFIFKSEGATGHFQKMVFPTPPQD